MRLLSYSIDINAPRKLVWDTLLDKKQYKYWASAFSKDPAFEGHYKEGERIRFYDSSLGGTVAVVEEVAPAERLLMKHVCTLDKELNEDDSSEAAKKWVGTREDYFFSENNGVTTLLISIKCDPGYEEMFNENWPKALEILKQICEDQIGYSAHA